MTNSPFTKWLGPTKQMCRRQSVNPALVSYYTSKTQVVSTTRDVNRDARQKYGHIVVNPGCSRNNFIYN
jgi:hypothetical protein